jgi:hypothetical protein
MAARHSKEVKDKALKLWLEGLELEEISKELNLLFDTLKTWHARYKWSLRRKQQNETNDRRLKEKIAQQEAKYQINVRNEYIDRLIEAKKKREIVDEDGLYETVAFLNCEKGYLFDIAKIDGLISDKRKHEIDAKVTIIPLLGGDSVKKQKD